VALPLRSAVSRPIASGIDDLLAAIDRALLLDPIVRAKFRLPAGDGATLAMLHACGRVSAVRHLGEECEVEAEIPESVRRRLNAAEGNPQ